MVKASELVNVSPVYLGTPYSVMDCQAFVERCLKDVGIRKDLAGSNAWYRYIKANGWVGSPEECRSKYGHIPPGAFLFILKQDGKEPDKYKDDGIGNASHIGIYTGLTGKQMCEIGQASENYNFGNGAINSSYSHGCVCTSKFAGKSISGGWNRVGLWDQIDYENGGGGLEKQAVVVGGNLNVRSEPSKSAPRIGQIPNGQTVTVYEESGEWSRVAWEAINGYAMSQYLKPVEMLSVPRDQMQIIYEQIGSWLRSGSNA